MTAVTVAVGVLLLVSSPLAAQVDVGDIAVKWSQPPDYDNGQDFKSFWQWCHSPQAVVADDWRCLDGLPVTDFHWWGSYLRGEPGDVLGFEISIHADIPETVEKPSHPGELRWSRVFNMGEYGVVESFDRMNRTEAIYEYTVVLDNSDEWFRQDEGEIYWLNVVALTFDDYTEWGWHSALRPCPENGLDPAVHIFDYDPFTGEYTTWGSIYSDSCSVHMAFELTTIPEPGSLALMGTVTLTVVGVRRRRRMHG